MSSHIVECLRGHHRYCEVGVGAPRPAPPSRSGSWRSPTADAIFEHPRLVSIYDALDADRRDLDAYAAIVDEFQPRAVIDLGCGTGLLARRLARRGIAVTGVDPAAASLEFAQAQPGADGVRWVLGDASALPTNAADLVLMTGNAAQAVVEHAEWDGLLRRTHAALRTGGPFVVETRDPSRRAWERWTTAESHRTVEIDGVGRVETWAELTAVELPLISFRQTWVFESDGRPHVGLHAALPRPRGGGERSSSSRVRSRRRA